MEKPSGLVSGEDCKDSWDEEEYKASCERRVVREEMFRDAHQCASRAMSSLNDASGMNDGTPYGTPNLRNARKHAERLLAVIVELGG